MDGRQGTATGNTMQQAFQQGPGTVVGDGSSARAVVLQERLHLSPDGGIDDGRVFAIIDLVLVLDLADIKDVGQQFVQTWLGEALAAAWASFARHPALINPTTPLQFLHEGPESPVLQI